MSTIAGEMLMKPESRVRTEKSRIALLRASSAAKPGAGDKQGSQGLFCVGFDFTAGVCWVAK
ncbi:MAG: hypothetical protein MUE46_18745 [Xanthomonadales bacterium]|nr:hypothetical protein [Xanthomonadales bacterium]